tara:strand:+ start:537 stop:875 length:339 start_codon:yes stop_codon:yes gene_type:complete
LDVLAARLGDNPGDVEKAARVLTEIQAQLHGVLFAAPKVRNVSIRWPPPTSHYHAAMAITFKVEGRSFKTHRLAFRLDGRRVDNIRFNGRKMPTSAAVPEGATLIADSVNYR